MNPERGLELGSSRAVNTEDTEDCGGHVGEPLAVVRQIDLLINANPRDNVTAAKAGISSLAADPYAGTLPG
jgi:hypothetical protein